MNKIAYVAVGLLCSTGLTAQEDSHGKWFADFDTAAAEAKKAGKDLLVDFTGSDWCGWCIKLHKEVFGHEEFTKGVENNFVLVALDFPHDEEVMAKVPNPERNRELQEKYGITGFPTVLAMTPDGEVFGRTGYQRGGVEPYLKSLEEMLTTGKATLADSKKIEAEFAAAKGEARTAVLNRAIATLEGMEPDAVGIAVFAGVAKHGLKSEDQAVQLAAVNALLTSGQQDDATITIAEKLDPENENGLQDHIVMAKMKAVSDKESALAFMDALDDLVVLGAKDDKLLETMLAQAAGWAFGAMKDKERAGKYADLLTDYAADVSKYDDLFKALGKK